MNFHRRAVKNLFSQFCPWDTDIFRHMKILKLPDVHKLNVATYMFKILRMNLYPTLQASLDLNITSHSYDTRHSDDFVLPFPRVNALRINFKYQYVKIWNDIPDDIKSCQSLGRFKNSLTEYFVSRY